MAVIVTWNSAKVIRECLDGLRSVPAIVIDNASSDGTVERARERGVGVIANRENRGFAAAVNQGFRASNADSVLVINPDVTLLTAVDELAGYPLAAGKLVDGEGNAQRGFTIRRFPTPITLAFEALGINRLWPSNPVNRRYRYLDRDLEEPGEVEQPAGALMMIRRDVWEQLGGFDESFHPLWFEDVDFCRRAAAAGYRARYLPQVVARHQGAHSVDQLAAGCRGLYWCASLLTYAAKHFPGVGYRGVCAGVLLGSVPRMVAGMVRERSLKPLGDYSKIIRFASLCLFSRRSVPRYGCG